MVGLGVVQRMAAIGATQKDRQTMKRHLTTIACAILACGLAAENLTFTWSSNAEPEVTGYVLDYSKSAVPAGVRVRSQVANWLRSTNVTGRTTTTVTLPVDGSQLIGTNYFYLTAVTATPGLTSDLSAPVRAIKPVPVAGAALVSVTVQSTTNLALLNWQEENTVPVEVSAESDKKFFRAKLTFVQASFPTNAVTPPAPPMP